MAAYAGEIIAAAQKQETTLKPILKNYPFRLKESEKRESQKRVHFVDETEVTVCSAQPESSMLPPVYPYFSHTDLPEIHSPERDQIDILKANKRYSYKVFNILADLQANMIRKYQEDIRGLNKLAFFHNVVSNLVYEKAGTFERENDLCERISFVVDEAMREGVYWVRLANAIVYCRREDILMSFKEFLQKNEQKVRDVLTVTGFSATNKKQFLTGLSYRIWQLLLDKDQWKLLSKIHEEDKISLFAKEYLDECFKEKNIKDKKKIISQSLQKPRVHFEEKMDYFVGYDKYLKDRLERFISGTFETLSSKIPDEDTEKKYLKMAIRKITAQEARLSHINDPKKRYNSIVRHVEKKVEGNAHLTKIAEIFVKEKKLLILAEFRRKNNTYHLYGNQPYESGENSADQDPIFNEANLITGFTKWISKQLIAGKWYVFRELDRDEGGLKSINVYTNWYLRLEVRQYNFTHKQHDKYRKNILMVLLTPDITSFYRNPGIPHTDSLKFKMPGADENNQFEFNGVLYSWNSAWENFACSEYGKYLLGEYGKKVEDSELLERIYSLEKEFNQHLKQYIKQGIDACLSKEFLPQQEMEIFHKSMEEYIYRSVGLFWCIRSECKIEESLTSLHAVGMFSDNPYKENNQTESTRGTSTKTESHAESKAGEDSFSESDSDKEYAADKALGTGDVVIRMQSF
ncbi:MAG: hypothetical protein K0R12_399 [Gammaproteobacteria bacterium]|jgi:hypothetical protein|nr:hypothetical protein [Gammaproteobacteria bacterium]